MRSSTRRSTRLPSSFSPSWATSPVAPMSKPRCILGTRIAVCCPTHNFDSPYTNPLFSSPSDPQECQGHRFKESIAIRHRAQFLSSLPLSRQKGARRRCRHRIHTGLVLLPPQRFPSLTNLRIPTLLPQPRSPISSSASTTMMTFNSILLSQCAAPPPSLQSPPLLPRPLEASPLPQTRL